MGYHLRYKHILEVFRRPHQEAQLQGHHNQWRWKSHPCRRPNMGIQLFHRGDSDQMGKEVHMQQNIIQSQDIIWITVPRSHKVLTLHCRQAIQSRLHQQQKRRSHRDIKIRKWRDYDVCHDASATPIAAQLNEREQQIGPRNGTSVNKKWWSRWRRCKIIYRRHKREKTTQTRRRDNSTKGKKFSTPNRATKSNASKGTIMKTLQAGVPFRKILFWGQIE